MAESSAEGNEGPGIESADRQVMFPFLLREFLDGISQQHAGHRPGVFVEEGEQPRAVFVTGVSEHPARPFVHQVFGIVDEYLRYSKCIVDIALFYKMCGRDDGT